MGSGIQRICNLDGERVNTFIIDTNSDFDEVKRDILRCRHEDLSSVYIKDEMTFAEKRKVVLHLYMDGKLPVTVTDDCVYEHMNDDDDNDIDNISYEVGALDGFERLKKRESDWRLVSGFRDRGIILAKSANCMLVIADNQNGYVIGCVPADTMDDVINGEHDNQYDQLRDEAEAELVLTRKRADASYEITRDDIDSLAEQKATEAGEKAWEEYVEKYRADANAAMRKVHEFLGTQSMHVPTSAWTSAKMKVYDEMTEEERSSYY